MKTCWDVLGIEKTGDLSAIQRARRSLIKEWHPDSVTDPAEKHARTVRCAELNAAFDQAAKISNAFKPLVQSGSQPPVVFESTTSPFNFSFGGRNQCLVAMGLVLLFTFQSFVYSFIALAALAVLTISLGLVALLDIVFVTLILKPMLSLASRIGPTVRRNERVVMCLAILGLNIMAVKFWPTGTGLTLFGALIARILRISVACSVPVWLFFLWLNEPPTQPYTNG